MTRVYWDTMLFIYWLEGAGPESDRVGAIYRGMTRRGDWLCTSVFTLGELLTKPYQRGAWEAAERLRLSLAPPQVELLPFTVASADRYARVRAQHRVQPADALHLASAAQAGVDLFLTNDRRLQGLVIDGIGFVTAMDVNLY